MRRSLVHCVLFATLSISLVGASKADDPIAQLRAAIDAPSRVSYVGEVQALEIGQSQSAASVYRIEHVAPDLTRRWYLAPESLYGDSIVTRGAKTYNVDVKRNRLVVDTNDAIDDQVALNDNFSLLMSNYRAVAAPDTTVAGRPVEVVLLMNKHTGAMTMRISIDSRTNLVLQKERFAGNGSLSSQIRFEQIRYTSSIPAAVFNVPSGMQQIHGSDHGLPSNDIAEIVHSAGFATSVPRYLPDGFVPIAGDVTDINGVRTLHLLYSDGIRTVSLFQNAKGAAVEMSRYNVHQIEFENHGAQYVEDGPLTLLAWEESGSHFALVGELSRDELIKIATSVVP